MKYIFVLVLACLMTACSSSSDANRALTAAGFTDIQTHGWAAFACSEDDFYSTKFTATNPQGKRVEGAVCSGFIFKNATIRY